MIISRDAVRVLSTTVFSHFMPGVEERVLGACSRRKPPRELRLGKTLGNTLDKSLVNFPALAYSVPLRGQAAADCLPGDTRD
jgi:hypothetical protein